MKKFFLFVFCGIFIASISMYFGNLLNSEKSLSKEEKRIFEALITASDKFYDPCSVKVKGVFDLFNDRYIDSKGPRCLIEISSKNKSGIITTGEYILWLSDWRLSDIYHDTARDTVLHKKGEIKKCRSIYEKRAAHDFKNVNVKKINRALDLYWQKSV